MGGSLTTSTAQVSKMSPRPKFFSSWQRSACRSRARTHSQRVGRATSEDKTTFETLRSQREFPPSISAEMLTIAVCTHANPAERASMVSIRTVVIVIRRASTEVRCVKTLTIVVLARLFEQWRQDASENPMRVTSVKSSCLNVKVVTDWPLLSPHLQRRGAFPRCDDHICFDSDSWKDCREITTKLV